MGGEINAADCEVQSGLALRLVHGIKQVRGNPLVLGLQAALFLRLVLLPVVGPIAAAIHSVFRLHVHLRLKEIPLAECVALTGSAAVVAELERMVAPLSRRWQCRFSTALF